MRNYAVIIPVLNPTISLVDYVKSLLEEGAPQIIVVNDGSNEDFTYIFTELKEIEGCTILTHEANKGKGRALKTAFTYFLEHFKDLTGVITADADGQHTVADVCKIAKVLENTEEGIILGSRDFNISNIPNRSKVGNKLTSFIFKLLYGYKINDTQTGLRGIPKIEIPAILNLKGERYEYEMNMLIYAKGMNIKIYEEPIETLYFNNNADSHYHSIIDSTKIFVRLVSGFLQYCFSTITSGAIDIFCFVLLNSFLLKELPLEARVLYATLVSRIISSSYNFYMNRRVVFKGRNALVKSIIKYYILCLGIILSSYTFVTYTHKLLGVNVTLTKICFDILLGICSYQIQLHWVFRKKKKGVIRGSETYKG